MSLRRLALLVAVATMPAAAQTYVVSNAPIEFPVNTPGATFTMTGIFPAPNFFAGGTQYGVCFYTGYGDSSTPIIPTNATSTSATVTVPASSFQVTAGFGTDGFNRSGKFYIAPAASTCDGTYSFSLTSENPLLIALPPTLTSITASSIEQPNTSVPSVFLNVAPPHTLTFNGNYFYGSSNGGPASVVFNWSSSTTSTATQTASVVPTQNSLVVSVPALPNDVSNLTAQVCNPVGTYTSCSAAINIPVNALIPSSGTVNSSASPATLNTQVNLTAEFSPAGATGPGSSNPMPTGTVTFTSDNTGSVVTIGTAPLVLDPTTSLFAPASFNQFTVTGAYPALPTVTADLNKDGLADVILYSNTFTNPSTQAVTPAQFTVILGNMPFGTFQTPTTLALPTHCASVTSYALGDLNTDGFFDLVLACVPLSPTTNDPYETYVLLGNGDGTFGAPYQITGVTGSLVALADVNNDGKLDLISQGSIYGQSNSYGFVVLQGDGFGDLYSPGTNSSYPGSTTSTGSFVPGSQFLMVDLNNDGFPDLAELHVNGPNGNTIDIYLNHGGTYFGGGPSNGAVQPDTYAQLAPYPSNYTSLFAGDLNKDGLMDLGAAQTTAMSSSSPYSIDYVLSSGTGTTPTFGTYQSLGLSNAPTYVAAADFTGDGYPDLVVGSSNTQVYDNDGTGQFVIDPHLTSSTYPTPLVIAAVDLNGDSVSDLIVGLAAYPNNGSAYTVSGDITSGSAIATLPYTFTTGTNANITATWQGSASIAAPTSAPTLSLPLTGTSSGGGSGTPTYSVTNSSPSSITVGSGDTYIIIAGNPLPTFGSGTYGVCFYTGYGASSTVIIPNNNSTNASFTIPASSIQQIPASAFSNGSFSAQIYVIAAGGTCDGNPDPTLTNTYGLSIASNPASINNLQVPFVPALNPNLGGEGGPPAYPSNLLGTGSNFLGTGQTPNSGSAPLTQLYETVDGSQTIQTSGAIFSPTSLVTFNPTSYPYPTSSVGVQACDNLGSACSNTLTVPVQPLESNNGAASYQVLNANTETIAVPASGTYQAANAGFYSDTSAATYSTLTNVSPYTPQATGQYSVNATGLYTFYTGDIGATVSISYDTTSGSTSPTVNSPIALKATFGTATPDVTGAPSGSIIFTDNTYTSYRTALTLDPTATWVAAGGGSYSGIGQIALRPTLQDFNNDSIPDVLVVDDGAQSGAPSLQLLTGTLPSGTYTSGAYFYVQSVLPNCATIASYAVADFNQDGYPDVAVLCAAVSAGAHTLSVLLNNGDGTFNTTPLPWGSSINGSQIVTGDFNGDGLQDIVYSGNVDYNGSNQTYIVGFQVLTGDGTGNFTQPNFYTRVPLAVGTQLAAADFDQDGYADLAVLNGDPGNPNIAIYQNIGATAGSTGAQFNPTPTTIAIPSAASVSRFSIASLGSGQLPSIVFPVTGVATPGVYAALNTSSNGAIAFASAAITPVANLANAVFGDINGDGNLDAVVDNGTTISVLTGDGIGDFSGTAFTALTLPDTGNTLLAALDQNDDGYADLFTYTTGASNNVHSYISAGTASAATAPATFSSGAHNILASTSGTVQIASGAATTSFNVSQYAYTDSLTVTTSATPSAFGQPVQIYATLSTLPAGGMPTGKVTFYDGATQIGASYALNSSGVATLSTSALSVGPHNLTAQYPGDGTYPAATSPIFVQIVSQITPTITWATPAAIVYGTALSGIQLNATATDGNGNTVPGIFNYTPGVGTVLTAGSKPLSVTFTPTDTTTYSTANLGNTIQVNKATPTVTWAAPAAITYGTALSATQLNATSPVAGVFTYNPASGAVLNAGTQGLSVNFVPADAADYNSVIGYTNSIQVNKATPSITWTTPAAITYGTALSATQLNATSPVAGVFTYNPASGAVLNAGTQGLSVGFVPTDTADYNAVPVTTTSLLVNKATPILTYNPTPLSIPYGTALSGSQLSATSSDPTGSFSYTYTGTASGTAAVGNVLSAGSYVLKATFNPTDTNYNAASITGGTLVVSQATPVLSWATPADIIAGVPLTATQLNATVGGAIPGTLTYTPASGTVLSAGNGQTLSVKFTPTDVADYTTATTTTAINVIPLIIGAINPGTALVGDPAKPITLTGTGFLANSVVQANGAALTTTFVNATTLNATVPASYFLSLSPIAITVLDPAQTITSNASAITVAAPVPASTFTGPSTVQPGQQPALTFNMTAAYPVPLTGTITLTFAGTGGVDDPAIQFASGTRTFTFTVPAGSTTTPTLQFQDGTDAGTITATLVLSALSTNVTPAAIQPVSVTVPPAPPDIATATLSRSGNTLTVFIVGYSNTRDMTTAQFHFNAANGATINDPDLTVQAPALFTPWFSQTASQAYGSNFGYTQTFNLSTDASSVGSVTVTLTNSVGNSITVTAQ